jgi:hypothetical protein
MHFKWNKHSTNKQYTAKFSESDLHRTKHVPYYRIFHIFRQSLYWAKVLWVIFFNCFYIWAAQLIHLDITLICRFSVIKDLFYALWSVHSWRSWWSGSQEVRRYHKLTCSWRPLAACPSNLPVSLMKLISGKKQNFWSWRLLSSARLLGLLNYRTPD